MAMTADLVPHLYSDGRLTTSFSLTGKFSWVADQEG